jgi:hypothetical protein
LNRTDAQNEFNDLLDAFEKRYIARVYKALKQPYQFFVNDLKAYGLAYARGQINTRLVESGVRTQIEKIMTSVGVFMANKTLRELKKNSRIIREKQIIPTYSVKYATFGFNEEWVRDILNYFRLYLLDKAVLRVSQTTRDHILRILEKATTEGWSNDQIVKEILESPEARIEVRNRARMIVRTETVRAANYGILKGADKYEYEVEKEWLAVNDNRTRRTHRHGSGVDGERRSPDGTFSNGLRFPGDPEGAASETIFCRCRLVMVAVRDAQGRLIPKIRIAA